MVVGCEPYAPAVFTPRKYSRYSFLLEADSTPGAIVRSEGFYVNEKSSDTSWGRTSDLPICSTYLNHFATLMYLSIFRKYVEKIQVSLHSEKNNGYFTRRPKHNYQTSLNSS